MPILTPSKTSTEEKIIQAAWQIARQQRFEQIQMQDIAEKAAVGRATLYRYYQTKEQLYADVTLHWGMRFFQQLNDAKSQPKTPRKRVHWVLQAIIEEAESERTLIRAFLSCILENAATAEKEFAEVSTLMPNLLSLALKKPVEEIPAQALRVLQHILLSGLIGLQRNEQDAKTVVDDLQQVADMLLTLDS